MLRKLNILGTLCGAFALALLFAPAAEAGTWGFYGQTYSNGDVMCSGDPNSPHLPSQCDLTSSGNARVKTSQFGQYCAASIWCGNTVQTCLASETRNRPPVMCFAVGYQSGAARATCKSDAGNFALYCPPGNNRQGSEDEPAATSLSSDAAAADKADNSER